MYTYVYTWQAIEANERFKSNTENTSSAILAYKTNGL